MQIAAPHPLKFHFGRFWLSSPNLHFSKHPRWCLCTFEKYWPTVNSSSSWFSPFKDGGRKRLLTLGLHCRMNLGTRERWLWLSHVLYFKVKFVANVNCVGLRREPESQWFSRTDVTPYRGCSRHMRPGLGWLGQRNQAPQHFSPCQFPLSSNLYPQGAIFQAN